MRVAAVVPVLCERAAIAEVVRGLGGVVDAVVVVDGGSTDGTAELARAAGADVIVERARGYGLAVARGVAAARADAYAIIDGNGTVAVDDAARLVTRVRDGSADLALGVRAPHHLRPAQRAGNRLAAEVIARRFAVRYADIAPVRVITDAALRRLAIDDTGYGWPVQLLARAAARGLRIAQLPLHPLPRLGRSKVSGTARGTVGAGLAFVRVLARECLPWSPA